MRSFKAITFISLIGLSLSAQADRLPPPRGYHTQVFKKHEFVDIQLKGHLLGKSEWIKIKTFITQTQTLPNTERSLRQERGLEEYISTQALRPLIKEYKHIRQLADQWQVSTYPRLLRTSLVLANKEVAPLWIAPLLDAVTELKSEEGDKEDYAEQKKITLKKLAELEKAMNEAQSHVGKTVRHIKALDTAVNYMLPSGGILLGHWQRQKKDLNQLKSYLNQAKNQIKKSNKVDKSLTILVNKISAQWNKIHSRAERGIQNAYLI